ncbi:MAG: hypothetical protein JW882_08285 [Deltaproteobacteria bacterium]|nr:hypothetical protein [Deltaproteobacteria bacterium]
MKFLLPLLLFSMINTPGCGTVKSAYKAGTDSVASLTKKVMPGKKAILKKRTLVFPIMNQSIVSDKKIAEMTETLVQILSKNDHLFVIKSEEEIPTERDIKSPEFGVVLDPKTTQHAEEMGVDVVITLVLNPMEVSIVRTGIWPLRKFKREIETSTALNALNVINGTLYLTHIETREIRLKEEVWEEDMDNWEFDENMIAGELNDMLEDHAEALLNILDVNPWSGKIIGSDDNGICRINGGRDIGIAVDNVFEVFDKGEPIRSASGREYFLRGNKVGELIIREVLQDQATAAPVDDGRFEVGQIVRLKK